MACHIQIFALSRWMSVNLPIEYYEFAKGIEWSIPYMRLPWEGPGADPFLSYSTMPAIAFSELLDRSAVGAANNISYPRAQGLPVMPMQIPSDPVLPTELPGDGRAANNISYPRAQGQPVMPMQIPSDPVLPTELPGDGSPIMPMQTPGDALPVMPMQTPGDAAPVMPMQIPLDGTPLTAMEYRSFFEVGWLFRWFYHFDRLY
jgi:hypothetical protein